MIESLSLKTNNYNQEDAQLMLQVSEDTVKAVVDKAQQQTPEDFSTDFLAKLRLENRELHSMTDGFLNRFISELAAPGLDREEVKRIVNDDALMESMVNKCGERLQLAADARLMAAALVGIVYGCMKAEIEAKELEG